VAFEELVRRHGPMVLRVCQRVLHHAQDAEDAFQATFLVLARKASAISRQELVANWLYGVAYRTALNAKKHRTFRPATMVTRSQQEYLANSRGPRSSEDLSGCDLHSALAGEVNRLPDKYRACVVLCYLEGKTNEQAAQLLRCEIGAIQMRLLRARNLLRS